ncbi:MAG: S-methyl-5-thioribose-1-phosphate isomerase [Candidatus Krumholzibacteria bacterium]|nr:S-methyl-5-thioribose-1-phosphate isomerase [Candidatus Krumholzibacteria bacterium]
MIFPTVDYRAGRVRIIDQTLLPHVQRILGIGTVAELAKAIRSLRVRGAPAIGIAAAYGMLLALENMLRAKVEGPPEYFFDRLERMSRFAGECVLVEEIRENLGEAKGILAQTRPTAVNLFWALDRLDSVVQSGESDPVALCSRIAEEAFRIHDEELEIELAIGANGSRFIDNGMGVLTHCNAGGLATAGYGTALGVIYRAHEEGKRFRIYADETRPLLQGARLTVWELQKRGIEVVVLCDGAAASLFAGGKVDAVIVGADRIAGNGDTANKIGTLGLAILCEKYGRPFYIAAPLSTFDLDLESGKEIPIEERSAGEVTSFAGVGIVPDGTVAYNPAFDVTPAQLVTAIITEKGVIEHPSLRSIRKMAVQVD